MTEAKKAREFWTDGHIVVDSAEDAYSMREGGYNLKHVIEYSALQALIDENAKLVEKLKSSKGIIAQLIQDMDLLLAAYGHNLGRKAKAESDKNLDRARAYLKEQGE